jgi:hypothetical protein
MRCGHYRRVRVLGEDIGAEIAELVALHRDEFLEAWNDFFGG